MELEEVVEVAKSRINAQSDLLCCYRLARRPSEKLFDQLRKSEIAWEKVLKEAQGET